MTTNVLWTYAGLARIYTVLPLALLSFAIGTTVGVPTLRAAAAACAIASALAGGYAYNDLRDQPRDRVNRPARPLVSGRLTDRRVRRFIAIAFGAAVLLAATTTSPVTTAFVIVLIGCLCLYSDVIKYVAGLKNLFVGVWCGLLPWGASLEHVDTATIVPASAVVALFVAQKELVADVYDHDGDAAAGVVTVPVLLGRRTGVAVVLALNIASWVLAHRAGALPLRHLAPAAQVAATINAIALCVVAARLTNRSVRAYLELQKVFLIGGCLVLFAIVMAR